MLQKRKSRPTGANGVILKIRQSRTFRGLAICLAMNLIAQMIQPTVSLALTEGPSQPEVQSFEPIGTTQMVDLFTGDFNYNIPLFNLPGPNGGYPVNLSYHAGVTMDDEASWVGLGWNINAGALVRNMRGLPDEFLTSVDSEGKYVSGDFIETKNDMKDSWTLGLSLPQDLEVAAGGNITPAGLSASLRFNNYRGLGVAVKFGNIIERKHFTLGFSLDSENGLGVNPSLHIADIGKNERLRFDLGVRFDGNLSLKAGLSRGGEKDENGGIKHKPFVMYQTMGVDWSFARNNYTPSIGEQYTSFGLSFNLSKGKTGLGMSYDGKKYGVDFSIQHYQGAPLKRPVVGYAKAGLSPHEEFFTQDFSRMKDGQITRASVILPHSVYSNDIYSSTGQGLSGFFRGRRNDIGRVHDPKNRNTSLNLSADLEITKIVQAAEGTDFIEVPTLSSNGFPTGEMIEVPLNTITDKQFGIGGSFGVGWETQGAWDEKNGKKLDFKNPSGNPGISENHYYKAHGEMTLVPNGAYSHLNDEDLALLTFKDELVDFIDGQREILASENSHVSNLSNAHETRMPRNTLIHTLKNNEVVKLGEFAIRHFDYTLDAVIDPVTGGNVMNASSYHDDPDHILNRNDRSMSGYNSVSIKNHNAGFKVLNQDGTYYVYALPAYNLKEVQNQFSVPIGANQFNTEEELVPTDGSDDLKYDHFLTHKYIDKKTTSPYAHSYMLSSVQGADYVDVNNDGPTDDDLGYWVKFDYVKYADDIKWRSPYVKANFNAGQTFTAEDDKGSYTYGEKEQWYLGRIETKTHIALFELSERDDMKEAESELSNSATISDNRSGLRVEKIKIYVKSEYEKKGENAEPLQVVHFDYDYSLCKDALNSDAVEGGKLTLKKVWFTSSGSNRGALAPYEFDYTSVNLNQDFNPLNIGGAYDLVNPNYNQRAYDSWGGYRPYTGNVESQVNFPYVTQTTNSWGQEWMNIYSGNEETEFNKEVTKTANDLIASAWCLRKIKLPSGGNIEIQYESDDYSHVQHKVANQLFKIAKLGDVPTQGQLLTLEDNQLYHYDVSVGSMNFSDNPEFRRIYFKLEIPIPESSTNPSLELYNAYVAPIMKDENGDRNLYYKTKVNLTGDAVSFSDAQDYVSGYIPLEPYNSTFYGVDEISTIDGNNCYTRGFVTVKCLKRKNGSDFENYHPIALQSWQFIQTNAPELLNPASSFNSSGGQPQNVGDVLSYLSGLVGMIPSTAAKFAAIRPYCESLGFAKFIDLNLSGIRLASPDRKKFGGGHRVKQITITDEWSSDIQSPGASRTYGQEYSYTIVEDGVEMSSGVAQYEPQAGGDENALKYPIHFYGKQNLLTNNNLMAEGPINESLFPGASVGYRKVTVKSLNTSNRIKEFGENPPADYDGGRTGGITEYEFYTSKDFPTLVDYSILSESNNTMDEFKLPIMIPFVGSITREFYHGSQAFKIELNDMHGKPKSVRSFELNGYIRNNNPITESVYEYQVKPISYQQESVFTLDNTVNVIKNDGQHGVSSNGYETMQIGVENELFTDQREHKSRNTSIGLGFNTYLGPTTGGVPVVTYMPEINDSKTLFRTYVTNKVIHKSGVLKRTKSKDLQTENESEIIAYDEKSGTPVLTKMTNEFGDDFYNYQIPAYYHYDRMGHAYRNINFDFCAEIKSSDEGDPERASVIDINVEATNEMIENLVRGDELLVTSSNGSTINEMVKGYFLGFEYDGAITNAKIQLIDAYEASTVDTYCFKVIRSGRRNHYTTIAASYLTKGKIDLPLNVSGEVVTTDFLNGFTGTTVSTPVISGDVLSASASLFKDDWATSVPKNNIPVNTIQPGLTENPFLTGNSGIFRPYKSYSYVGARNGNASMHDNSSSSPNLAEDGTMDVVPMFTWEIGNMEDYVSNWEWVNEVTRFSSDAYEIENVNRLGVYSSALYGYDNSLSIAVGGNSSVYEIGVYDFEMSDNNAVNYQQDFNRLINQTNMNFNQNDGGSILMTEQFDIKWATTLDGKTISIKTDIPFSEFDPANYEENVGLSLLSQLSGASSNEGCYVNGTFNSSNVSNVGGFVAIDIDVYLDDPSGQNLLVPGTNYIGKMSLLSMRSSSAVPALQYATDRAHTGKQCLEIQTANLQFEQPQLKLIKDKKYILSLWVSKDNTNVPTYEPGKQGNPVNSLVSVGTVSGTINVSSPKFSRIIEGWQKVDLEIEAITNNPLIVINFLPSGGDRIYVDDIRFSPKTGGATSYVYDPSNFWLRASLNVDNYATLFYYDEEGNLTLKKQETEEGIFTVTESRGHVSE